MGVLPIPDLESTSLVNSTWEEAALRHLLVRNPVVVRLQNITDSNDLVPLVALSPPHLKIVICDVTYWVFSPVAHVVRNVEMLSQKIHLFSSINFPSVTKLHLDLPLDNSLRHVASRLIQILEKSLRNLRSLELKFILTNYNEKLSFAEDWKELFPDSMASHAGKKLTALVLNGVSVDPADLGARWDAVISLITRILTIFRQVGNLTLFNLPGGVLDRAG